MTLEFCYQLLKSYKLRMDDESVDGDGVKNVTDKQREKSKQSYADMLKHISMKKASFERKLASGQEVPESFVSEKKPEGKPSSGKKSA